MATGQTLLDLMEVLAPELQLQSGEADVVKGLIALNRAQDTFESLMATYPDALSFATTGTVTTTADTETTTYPAEVLRLDGLDFIDATTSRPAWPLAEIRTRGGHAWHRAWPMSLVSTSKGKPRAYWTNGRLIYWDPLPDATHTVRWYGLQMASAITAAGTLSYPEATVLPLAIFAVKMIQIGLGDSVGDLTGFARDTFEPTIKALGNYKRESAAPYQYSRSHDT